jgi:carboxylesterase type B
MVLLSTRYLGELQGKTDGVVEEYLGIPYATLRNRWADAVLVSDRDGSVLDATNYG